jgi:hypothetical protein
MRGSLKFKFLPLPPDFDPVDATVEEIQAFRRESRWTVHRKLRDGTYESYLDDASARSSSPPSRLTASAR